MEEGTGGTGAGLEGGGGLLGGTWGEVDLCGGVGSFPRGLILGEEGRGRGPGEGELGRPGEEGGPIGVGRGRGGGDAMVGKPVETNTRSDGFVCRFFSLFSQNSFVEGREEEKSVKKRRKKGRGDKERRKLCADSTFAQSTPICQDFPCVYFLATNKFC